MTKAERNQKIAELYRSGFTLHEICKRVPLGKSMVHKVLVQLGVERRSAGRPRRSGNGSR